jgi:hypothetical protein
MSMYLTRIDGQEAARLINYFLSYISARFDW